MKLKICIMFFGLLRRLDITLLSIRKNIFIALEKQGIDYDIYVHTYKINKLNNPRAGENNIKYNNNQILLFKHPSTKIKVDDQDEVDKILQFDKILIKNNPWPEDISKISMKNLIRQYYSLKSVFNMVKNENKNYDGYLFLRPDMIYLNPIIINPRMFPINKHLFFSSQLNTYTGVNDRFCLTSHYGAEIYSSRLDEVYDETNIHSETFLKKHLLKYNMQLFPLKIIAYRVRTNGTIIKG
jgi:hypothetical protein